MIKDVTAASLVEFALRIEETGAELYQGLARKFASEPELRDLFDGLGRDEVHHGEQIRSLQKRLAPRLGPASDEQREYLRAMSVSDVFSAPKGPARDVEGIRSRDDALERALNLEKATLAFYQAVREVAGPDEVLDSLVAMEKKHVVKVMQLLITGAKFRGLGDAF